MPRPKGSADLLEDRRKRALALLESVVFHCGEWDSVLAGLPPFR